MPKADVLSKFNILVRLIASMSSEQLQQTSRSIEVAQSSSNTVKSDMWMVFRDAVTQAGTQPAFKQIQLWIQSKKIQGEEAAQVVASLANTLRYPTKEVMKQFFDLAWSPEVSQQMYLNSTCLLAATKVINMAQVNNYTAHSYYPTHMYGRLARKHDRFVLDEVLPKLRENLKQAIESSDSGRAQVYIKAIGILGHRAILDVFAPYLEGKIPVSIYLRARMIHNLRTLAEQRDHHVRAVLFNILKNTAEPYEIRVACVHNIFYSRPTTTMIQVMAQMTHDDPSIEVRSALKSGIETASELRGPHFLELSRMAQSARPKLTKEKFGSLYSNKYLFDSYDSEYEMGMMGMYSYIGSEDSNIPKHFKMSMRSHQPGWNVKNRIAASVSSVPQFFDYVLQGIINKKDLNIKSESNHKFSAERIAEMLRIHHDPESPLEASLSIDLMNQLRFFTVTEEDMRQWPRVLQEQLSNLAKGVDIRYTKVFNQAQVSVMFPTATGMPFIYKYKVPTLVHIQGKAKGQVNFPTKENRDLSLFMNNEIQLTIARNIDGSVGFLDTITNQHACAGILSKLQLTIPVKSEITMKSGEFKINLRPLRPDQDTTLAHVSVWPYTASQNKDALTTISQDPSAKVVSRRNKVTSIDTKFGQFIDTVFQVQGYSYSEDYKNIGSLMEKRDLLSMVFEPLRQKDIALTHYNFRYLGKQSQSQGLSLHAVYDKSYYETQVPQGSYETADIKDSSPNSPGRREELMKRAVSGINKPRALVVDLSAVFEGSQKLEYVLTAALANSPIDPKVQAATFAGRNSGKNGNNHVNGFATFEVPSIPTMNFLEALKTDLRSNFRGELRFDQDIKTNIKVEGVAERTAQYTEALKKDAWGNQCFEEISSNNLYQPACAKMVTMARTPDYIKMSLTYKDISSAYKNMTLKPYRIMQHLGFWSSDLNVQKTAPDGKVELELQNNYIDNTMSLWLSSRIGEIRINDVPLPKVVIPALSLNTPLQFPERVLNHFTKQQYYPFCTVDSNRVRTFSNRTYEFQPTRSWHLVMHDDARYAGKHEENREQLAVLARRPSEKHLETYISYKSETGKDFEINIQPSAEGKAGKLDVATNAKKIHEGDLTSYWDDVAKAPLLEYYTRPDGVLMLEVRENRLRIMYDGERLVVFTNEHRNNTMGLCGLMTGEPRDDFITPIGVVDQPEYFSASYALNTEESDPQVQQLQAQSQQHAYQYEYKYTKILYSDSEWKNDMQSSSSSSSEEESSGAQNVYRTRSYKPLSGSCEVQQQVQYYENHGEICITTTPVSSCQAECRGEGYQIQNVQVVCRPRLDHQFVAVRDLIRQGRNPPVAGYSKPSQFRVPSTCRA